MTTPSPQPTDNTAPAGNATNPIPPPDTQLLGKEAEKYLRESANIEDLPDAPEQQALDETVASEGAPE